MERVPSIGRFTTTRAGALTRGAGKVCGRRLACSVAAALGLAVSAASAQSIVDEWAAVKAPPAPELKPVTLDPKTTALFLLDFVAPNCTPAPALHGLAAGGEEAAWRSPRERHADRFRDRPHRQACRHRARPRADRQRARGVDRGGQFVNTDLEKILKAGGTQTVVAMGTAAHGAVLYTASAASLRGMKVIVPVDGMSDSPYSEQYNAGQLAIVPLVSRNVTLTGLDLIRF